MLWLATLLVTLIAAFIAAKAGKERPVKRWLAGGVACAALIGVVILWPPYSMLRVMLVGLGQPLAWFWLGLVVLGVVGWRSLSRPLRFLWAGLCLFLTVLGNPWTSMAIMAWLERDMRPIDPLAQGPFDAVIVLGGGTATAPNGQAELLNAADRVAIGARLFLTGRTPWLITSGSADRELYPRQRSPAENTTQIWTDLGIPAERIVQIPGVDTEGEMIALSKLARERGWQKLGVVTSAWHLPRALNLAQRHGVHVAPLPADFRGFWPHPGIPYLAPQIEALSASLLGLSELRRYLRDR
jgi:uncharacterized SAM-binding protein YcdF (DUF218 family)